MGGELNEVVKSFGFEFFQDAGSVFFEEMLAVLLQASSDEMVAVPVVPAGVVQRFHVTTRLDLKGKQPHTPNKKTKRERDRWDEIQSQLARGAR